MAADIKTEKILGTSVSERWSVTPVEYEMTVTAMDGTVSVEKVDFQDLMVNVAEQRAATLEAEVEPLAARIRSRNVKLEEIGFALSQLASISAKFQTEEANPKQSATLDQKLVDTIYEVYRNAGSLPPEDLRDATTHDVFKASVDGATQKLKTWSERLNNDSQLNMSRMQTLVDHRDQSYNTATTMMNHISDARGYTIKAMN